MNNNQRHLPLIKPAVFLILIIGIIYSNTLQSGWYLDDFHNIVKNDSVQLNHLNPESITNSFYAAPTTNQLKRPLSYFSFALNWYFGQDDPIGYHVVNIGIHILTAFFLFLSVIYLLQTPNLKGWASGDLYFISLLSAVLWAIHPIQIQAVTYIVQRMASMAAMFYIFSIFCYLKARLTGSASYKIFFACLCGLAFLLGIASKSNALMLPVSLLLIEFLFFRDLSQKKTQKQAAAILLTGIAGVAVIGFFLFVGGNIEGILNGYETRPFTLSERLLTQPRVLLFYLSQFFYPIASRFSITHDISYSTSLFSPWSTLPSVVLIILAIGLALWRIKKNPVIAFAILFFLGNHIIESSIIPLEMIFEHRNYLPTLFLFVPVSIGIKKIFDYYRANQKLMLYFLVGSMCVVMIGLGMSTYIRNWDWHSAKSLWTGAMKKEPESARPIHNLAWGYYTRSGQIDKAIELYKEALTHKFEKEEYRADSYSNLSAIHYSRFNEYEKAADYAKKAISLLPYHNSANLLLCKSLGKLGRYKQALRRIDQVLEKAPNHQEFLYLKGLLLLQTSKPFRALQTFRKCLSISPENWKYLHAIGVSLTQMGHLERGHWFLKRSNTVKDEEINVLLALADNRIRAGKLDEAEQWIERVIQEVGVENTETVMLKMLEDPLGVPLANADIASLASRQLQNRSKKYSEMAARLTTHFSAKESHHR